MNSRLLRIEIGNGHGIHLLPQDGLAGISFVEPGPNSGPVEVTVKVVKKPDVEPDR